ncbi:MAG: hypothetical protein KKF48_04050 [Nanoarchaeota archaeon]|nr:hypothetical protein [Nanoarchaeota archaeon]MBU1028191.1 hypothetical protein [Nanoarchaeota archaeon]
MVLFKNKKANILMENIIFIILNLFFLSILILFIFKQGSGAVMLEESYAKNIALLIDSSKPVMILKLNMEEARKLADKNEIDFKEIVKINGNVVSVKLSDKSGYSYDFFNNVDVSIYPDGNFQDNYIIKINSYK